MSSDSNKQVRVCNTCGVPKSLERFGWLDKVGGRRDQRCRNCRQQKERQAQADQKAIEKQQGLAGLVQSVRAAKIDVPHISEYLASVLRRLGGVEILAQMQVDQIEMLLELRPGSPAAVAAVKDIAKLIQASTEYRHTAPDLAQVTDTQLNDILINQLTMRLAENPNFLEDAAAALGYRLVPMESVDAVSMPLPDEQPALPAPEAEPPFDAQTEL